MVSRAWRRWKSLPLALPRRGGFWSGDIGASFVGFNFGVWGGTHRYRFRGCSSWWRAFELGSSVRRGDAPHVGEFRCVSGGPLDWARARPGWRQTRAESPDPRWRRGARVRPLRDMPKARRAVYSILAQRRCHFAIRRHALRLPSLFGASTRIGARCLSNAPARVVAACWG